MKLWTIATMAVLGSVFFVSSALADDIADVKALEQGHYAARNRGDVATWESYHVVGRDSFGPGGGKLETSTSLETERKKLVESLKTTKYNHKLTDINVRIYGNVAIATSYITGSSGPAGKERPTSARRTAVLLKENGKWHEIHDHISPLVPPK